jgi:hypothetical protein
VNSAIGTSGNETFDIKVPAWADRPNDPGDQQPRARHTALASSVASHGRRVGCCIAVLSGRRNPASSTALYQPSAGAPSPYQTGRVSERYAKRERPRR